MRWLNRRLTRWSTRLCPGGRRPDHLAIALKALAAAFRARRRLIRLAPRLYDAAIVERERREYLKCAAQRLESARALAKVYEVPLEEALTVAPWEIGIWGRKGAEKVNPGMAEIARRKFIFNDLPRHTRCAIVQAGVEREAQLKLHDEALDRWRRYRPYDLPSLSQLATLVEFSTVLGRLIVGMETG